MPGLKRPRKVAARTVGVKSSVARAAGVADRCFGESGESGECLRLPAPRTGVFDKGKTARPKFRDPAG